MQLELNAVCDTYSRNKSIEVGPRSQIYWHDITDVTMECLQHGAWLHIPQCGGGITRAGQHLVIWARKQATWRVAGVGADCLLAALAVLLHGEWEHCQLVVQSTTGHSRATGRVGAPHHPGGGQCQGMLFVGGESVLKLQSKLTFHATFITNQIK